MQRKQPLGEFRGAFCEDLFPLLNTSLLFMPSLWVRHNFHNEPFGKNVHVLGRDLPLLLFGKGREHSRTS